MQYLVLTNIGIFISRTQISRHMRTVFMKAERFNIKTFLNCDSVDVKSNFIHLYRPCFLMHSPSLHCLTSKVLKNFNFYKINYDSFSCEILLHNFKLFLQSGFY